MSTREGDREVEFAEELEILPDQARDDSDIGWERTPGRKAARRVMDQRLLDERPPHWE